MTTVDPFALPRLARTETRPRRAVRGGPWCFEHVNLIRTPPAVETVAQNPGVCFAKRQRSCAHSPARNHEGMDWGAVGTTCTRTTHANPLIKTVTRTTCRIQTKATNSPDLPIPTRFQPPRFALCAQQHLPPQALSGMGHPRSEKAPKGMQRLLTWRPKVGVRKYQKSEVRRRRSEVRGRDMSGAYMANGANRQIVSWASLQVVAAARLATRLMSIAQT